MSRKWQFWIGMLVLSIGLAEQILPLAWLRNLFSVVLIVLGLLLVFDARPRR